MEEKTKLNENEFAIKENAKIRLRSNPADFTVNEDGSVNIDVHFVIAAADVQFGEGDIKPAWSPSGVFSTGDASVTSAVVENLILSIDSSSPAQIAMQSKRNDMILITNGIKGRDGNA